MIKIQKEAQLYLKKPLQKARVAEVLLLNTKIFKMKNDRFSLFQSCKRKGAFLFVNALLLSMQIVAQCPVKKVGQVTWLYNTYDPKAELESSYNWGLPSAKACVKYISGEIKYKMGVGIDVKIVRMFSVGLIDNSEYRQWIRTLPIKQKSPG